MSEKVKDLRKQAEASGSRLLGKGGNMTFIQIATFLRNSSENKFKTKNESIQAFKVSISFIFVLKVKQEVYFSKDYLEPKDPPKCSTLFSEKKSEFLQFLATACD